VSAGELQTYGACLAAIRSVPVASLRRRDCYCLDVSLGFRLCLSLRLRLRLCDSRISNSLRHAWIRDSGSWFCNGRARLSDGHASFGSGHGPVPVDDVRDGIGLGDGAEYSLGSVGGDSCRLVHISGRTGQTGGVHCGHGPAAGSCASAMAVCVWRPGVVRMGVSMVRVGAGAGAAASRGFDSRSHVEGRGNCSHAAGDRAIECDCSVICSSNRSSLLRSAMPYRLDCPILTTKGAVDVSKAVSGGRNKQEQALDKAAPRADVSRVFIVVEAACRA
jgi:hypothetical protein